MAYGIAPVFRHTARAKSSTTLAPSQSRTIKGFNHAGRLVALERGQALDFHSFERPSREDLRPGEMARGRKGSADYHRELARREGKFRVRAVDPQSPERFSLPVSVDWRRLTKYPNYPDGRPSEYAYRVALQTRLRNQMEGHFNRMQSTFRLATPGPDRVRVVEKDTVEGLIRLAELRMCALSLADERERLSAAAGPPRAPMPPELQGSNSSSLAGDVGPLRRPAPERTPARPIGDPSATNVVRVDFRRRRVVARDAAGRGGAA